MRKSLFGGTALQIGLVLMTGMGVLKASSPEPSGPSFKPSSFSRLPVKTERLEYSFQWPSEAAFRRTYEKFPEARPIPLMTGHLIVLTGRKAVQKLAPAPTWQDILDYLAVSGSHQPKSKSKVTLQDCPDLVMGFERRDGLWVGFDFLGLQSCQDFPRLSSLESLQAGPDRTIVQVGAGKVIAFQPASFSPPPSPREDLWDAWTYTSTLMELNRPLYDAAPDRSRETPAQIEKRFKKMHDLESALNKALEEEPTVEKMAAIRRALDQDLDGSSRAWDKAARFAEQVGDLDLALQLRSRYRPVGYCSMDTSPQEAARAYAELCFRMGDLPCFLNLQVRIMGDAFERVAYSSYGEAAHGTEAERLRDIGIDVGLFLKGLIVRFDFDPSDRVELGDWRLARSIKEIDQDFGIESFLDSVASDPGVDAYNRLRATIIQVYLRIQRELPTEPDGDSSLARWQATLNGLRRQALSPEARLWIQAVESMIEEEMRR